MASAGWTRAGPRLEGPPTPPRHAPAPPAGPRAGPHRPGTGPAQMYSNQITRGQTMSSEVTPGAALQPTSGVAVPVRCPEGGGELVNRSELYPLASQVGAAAARHSAWVVHFAAHAARPEPPLLQGNPEGRPSVCLSLGHGGGEENESVSGLASPISVPATPKNAEARIKCIFLKQVHVHEYTPKFN